VKCLHGFTEVYKNGAFVGVVLDDKKIPTEPLVKNPKIMVLETSEDGCALLCQQISQHVYKKLGFACGDQILSYDENRFIKIEPGSVIHKALIESGFYQPTIDELCKGSSKTLYVKFGVEKQKTIFQHFGLEDPCDENENSYF